MQNNHDKLPLCVDLDGTLVLGDTTWQAVSQLLKRNVFNGIFLIYWIFKGRAFLKSQLARYVYLSPRALRYRQNLLSYLKGQVGQRPIYLVTGTDIGFARVIAEYLGIFNGVEASNGFVNLTKENKRDCLIKKFGRDQFIYIGNSFNDLPVWEASAEAWVCSNNARLLIKVNKLGKPERFF